MENLKFHKAPSLGLKKRNKPIETLEVSRLGIPSDTSDCKHENRFDFFTPKKVKDLMGHLNSTHFENNKFDAKTYVDGGAIDKMLKDKLIEKVEIKKDNLNLKTFQNKAYTNPQSPKIEDLKTEIDDLYYKILSKSLSLNNTVCYLDNDAERNTHYINFNKTDDLITYNYYIFYKDADQSISKTEGGFSGNTKYIAIKLEGVSAELLFFFVEKAYGITNANTLRGLIYNDYVKELEKTTDVETLTFLYKNLPSYIKLGYSKEEEKEKKPYKLKDELLWKHLLKFVDYDRGGNDASYYVLNTMMLLTPKYYMTEFRKDQSLVIKIYNGLDDRSGFEAFFGWYKFSETFDYGETTFKPTNKDVFVTLINAAIQLYENDSRISVFESSGAHFGQGTKKGYNYEINFKLDSNIVTSDTGDTKDTKNKIYLENRWDSEEFRGTNLNQQGQSSDVIDYDGGYEELGYFNPLDIVKFTQFDDSEQGITSNVPIILIKHAAYLEEWEHANKGIRFGGNVFAIIAGAALLTTGVGSLMLYATLADMGLATIDILIQSEAEKGHFKGKAGKEFLESWDKIYTIGGILTFSPVAIKAVATYGPKMVSSGADLLQVTSKTITNPQTYKKIKDLTTKAIHSLEIPNFNKTGLEILKKGFKSIPELRNADKLQKLGVIFVKGGEDTIAAIYKGAPIASGKIKGVAKKLYYALKKYSGKKLKLHLERLLEIRRINKATFRRIVYSRGQRGELPLTLAQKKEIVNYAKKYGIKEKDIILCDNLSDYETSYGLVFGKDVLYINTDVMPGVLNSANSRLSWRAALAHELEGHRKAALNNRTFFDSNLDDLQNLLLEEMQASIRSSKHGIDLTQVERFDLLQDAIERLEKYGDILIGTEYANKNIEQIKEILWIIEN